MTAIRDAITHRRTGTPHLLYNTYELNRALLSSASAWASVGAELLNNPAMPMGYFGLGPVMASALDVFAHAAAPRGKPQFGIQAVELDGTSHPVIEAIVLHRPFGNLLRFTHDGLPDNAPSLLIVAPMSGHYATLLRGTVRRMVEKHVVYITDWADARMVPLTEGRFDLDDYVDYIIEMLHTLGTNMHVIAVCQPSVPVVAAVSVMEAERDPFVPVSMTLMGGPIDTRRNPTAVNNLAAEKGIEWFRSHVITKVPFPHPGVMRDVYPGFLQLSGFISMNFDRHKDAHKALFSNLVKGDGDLVDKHREFYDEYLAVMDLSAEYYLQTVDVVFVKHALPKGEMTHRGKLVDPSRITRVALMTVEGENDDISGIGQTEATHALCRSIPDHRRVHYVQKGVGHYGVFNGSRFKSEIVPRISDFMLSAASRKPALVAAAE